MSPRQPEFIADVRKARTFAAYALRTVTWLGREQREWLIASAVTDLYLAWQRHAEQDKGPLQNETAWACQVVRRTYQRTLELETDFEGAEVRASRLKAFDADAVAQSIDEVLEREAQERAHQGGFGQLVQQVAADCPGEPGQSAEILVRAAAGESDRSIGRAVGVPHSTVRRRLTAAGALVGGAA